jgi:hypothetical protein
MVQIPYDAFLLSLICQLAICLFVERLLWAVSSLYLVFRIRRLGVLLSVLLSRRCMLGLLWFYDMKWLTTLQMVITTLNEGQRPNINHDDQISFWNNVDVTDNEDKCSVCWWRDTEDFGFCPTPYTVGYMGSCPGRQPVKGVRKSLE